jgi:hypothetical protein
MKDFKTFVEEKEDNLFEEELLLEDPLTLAGAILGYSLVGLLLGWSGALIVQGYSKLANKAVAGIKRIAKRAGNKNIDSSDVRKKVYELKADPKTMMMKEKQDKEYAENKEKFKDVFEAIQKKDPSKTANELKKVRAEQRLKNRLVILEATKVFGEPPLHYGNTGNMTYMFIKKVLGMKTAQAASYSVKRALKNKGIDLVKDIEGDM